MLVMALSLTACGPKYNTVDQIKENGKLVVYTEAGFAPYEFVYENEIVGVDIEIMKKVAEKLGVELVVEDVNFDSITGAVKGGKADAGAAGMTITAERAEEVDFSIPYASTEQYVIVTADNTTVSTVETMVGKTIGVQQGTTSDFLVDGLIADGTLAGSTLTPYDAPALAAAALGTKVDAVVTDKLTAEVIVASSNGAYKTFKLTKADGSDAAEVEEYGVCVGKGNESLLAVINEALEELLADGSVAAWEAQYNDLYSTIEE
jgi:polar amino acid transport system substrate-binding protein